jgi:hypothetical protein
MLGCAFGTVVYLFTPDYIFFGGAVVFIDVVFLVGTLT